MILIITCYFWTMIQNVDSYTKTMWINAEKTECVELYRKEGSVYGFLNVIRFNGNDTSYIRIKFTHDSIRDDYYRFKIEQISVEKTNPTKYNFYNQVRELADISKSEEKSFGAEINNRNKNGLSSTIKDAIQGNITEYWIYFGEDISFNNYSKIEQENDKILKINWANIFDNSATNCVRYQLVQE